MEQSTRVGISARLCRLLKRRALGSDKKCGSDLEIFYIRVGCFTNVASEFSYKSVGRHITSFCYLLDGKLFAQRGVYDVKGGDDHVIVDDVALGVACRALCQKDGEGA